MKNKTTSQRISIVIGQCSAGAVRKMAMVTALLCAAGATFANPSFAVAGPKTNFSALERRNETVLDEGIRFTCKPEQLAVVESGMYAYLTSLNISPTLVDKRFDHGTGTAVYTLRTPKGDTETINFLYRPEFQVKEVSVRLRAKNGKSREVQTVSQKEIMLALLQHGRLTEFKGSACDVQALKDHIGVRQSIVAWAESVEFRWPNGGPAQWNKNYWNRGTPRRGTAVHKAVEDVFLNQDKYAVGCYTAAKLVISQGVLDYYRNVKQDAAALKMVEARLLLDKDPLVNLEPGKMWSFEKGYDATELNRPGKILDIHYGVEPKNFVPGDWTYFVNTDPTTWEKTGYEGSNAIYLGRGKFSDYYNDNDHSYAYLQKLDDVYQWRNHVFSRSRDYAKIKPLSEEDFEKLGKSPSQGGLLSDFRVSPYYFGYQELPALPKP